MSPRSQHRLAVLLAALASCCAIMACVVANASAIEVAVSDDEALSGTPAQSGPWYQRAADMHANWRRIFVWGPDFRGTHRDEHVAEAQAHGLNVELTLHWTEWHVRPGQDGFSVPAYLAYVKAAAQRYPSVKRFSILNEPDLSYHVQDRVCGPQSKVVLKYKRAFRYRYVKRGKLYRKVRSHRKVKTPITWRVGKAKQITYVKARKGLYRKVVRKGNVYRARTFTVKTNGCRYYSGAASYRNLFRAAYMSIKSVRPDAQVMIGETSPHAYSKDSTFGVPGGFIADLLCQRPTQGDCKNLVADGFMHHPYQFSDPRINDPAGIGGGIGDACEQVQGLKFAHRMGFKAPWGGSVPMYYTEFGYNNMDRKQWGALSEDQIATFLPIAWKIAAFCGVKQNMQYMLRSTDGDGWDTGVYNMNGTPRGNVPAALNQVTGELR